MANTSKTTEQNLKVGLTGGIPHRLRIFQEERQDPSRNQGCQKVGFEPTTLGSVVQRSNHSANQLQLRNGRKILAIYAPTLLMYNTIQYNTIQYKKDVYTGYPLPQCGY